jgi:hypothetical protein
MDFKDYSKPMLTEPGIKYFLSETLKQCNINKNKYYNLIINTSLFFAFLIILGIILLIKYKGKLSEPEKQQKNLEKQQYILQKIKNFQEAKQRARQELITGLPHWENEYSTITNDKIHYNS